MASYNKFPKQYEQVIAESYALPANGTPVILTNIATINAAESGKLWVRVFASDTTVEITNPATLSFIPVVGTTTTEVATWGGGGHILPGIVISAITASANSVISWASGEMICEFALPMNLIKAINDSNVAGTARSEHKYLAIYAVAVSDEHLDNIEAYLYIEQ